MIVREGLSVRGITTAATIWTAASIGIAVSRDLHFVAIFAALLVVLLLEASPVTKAIAERGQRSRDDLTPAPPR